MGLSVSPVDCGKTPERIQMLFGVISRMGPGMRQVFGFGDRSMRKGNLGINMACPIETNGALSTIGSSQCTVAPLLRGISGHYRQASLHSLRAHPTGVPVGMPMSVPAVGMSAWLPHGVPGQARPATRASRHVPVLLFSMLFY